MLRPFIISIGILGSFSVDLLASQEKPSHEKSSEKVTSKSIHKNPKKDTAPAYIVYIAQDDMISSISSLPKETNAPFTLKDGETIKFNEFIKKINSEYIFVILNTSCSVKQVIAFAKIAKENKKKIIMQCHQLSTSSVIKAQKKMADLGDYFVFIKEFNGDVYKQDGEEEAYTEVRASENPIFKGFQESLQKYSESH